MLYNRQIVLYNHYMENFSFITNGEYVKRGYLKEDYGEKTENQGK